MKKSLLFLTLFSFFQVSAQEIEEDFDSYMAGDLVGVVSPAFETWSGGTADDIALVDSVFHSEPNSLSLFSDLDIGGPGDVIVPLDYSDMGYVVSFYMYVEPETGAYFNIQTDVMPGVDWAYDVFFSAAGDIDYQIAQISQGSGSYTNGAWILVENDIDLVNDIVKVSIDGEEQIQMPFVSNLGSVNFYPTSNEPTCHYYIDDVVVEMYQPVSVEEEVLNPSIFPNPTTDVINIADVPVGSVLTVNDLLGREVMSLEVSETISQISVSEWERGYYFISISTDNGDVTRKVIVE